VLTQKRELNHVDQDLKVTFLLYTAIKAAKGGDLGYRHLSVNA